jgi:hypothetical protein
MTAMKIKSRNKFLAIFILPSLLILALTNCGQRKTLSKEDFIQYCNSEKSNLIISKAVQNINYTCKFKIPELTAILNSNKEFTSQAEFEKSVKTYSNEILFIFTIKDDSKSSHAVKQLVFDKQKKYSFLLAYANTDMSSDFELKSNNGNIVPCSFLHLEPANSVQPILRITLAFNYSRSLGEELTLVFNDKIFNNGPIKFNYPKDVLDYLPKLKI